VSEELFFVALFALGVVSGGTAAVIGFGIGSLLTPFLLTRLEPQLAIGVVAVPHLLATAVRYLQHRTAVDSGVLLRFGVPSAVGGLAGAALQATFTSPLLLAVLGLLLVATGVANLSRGFAGWQPAPAAALVLGLLSGIFGGLAGNQGGLRAAGLTSFDLPPRAFLATGTAVALLIDLARTPVYVARAGAELAAFAAPMGVAAAGCLLGTVLGERLFFGLPRERYRQAIGVALVAVGAFLLFRAWRT
jgi:uncharacterized membrane protein YfcA